MGKLTLEELRKMREEQKNKFNRRDNENKNVQVIIGVGTCGIAAGAKETFNAFIDELEKKGLQNVQVKQTGCMGKCETEPTVEVIVPEMPEVLYGNVTAEVARKIVTDHIIGKKILDAYFQDKPSADIMQKGGN